MKGQIWNAITAVATTVIAIFVCWISTQIVVLKEKQAGTEVWKASVDSFMGTGTRFTQEAYIYNTAPLIEKINDHELRIRDLELGR